MLIENLLDFLIKVVSQKFPQFTSLCNYYKFELPIGRNNVLSMYYQLVIIKEIPIEIMHEISVNEKEYFEFFSMKW